jgi:arylsulfatase A-like enzyme
MRAPAAPALVLGLLAAMAPHQARGACVASTDGRDVTRAARLRAQCNNRILGRGPTATCNPAPPPPACSGTLVDDAIALAYGPNNPPASGVDGQALKDQLGCQKRIGKAVAKFVGTKLRYLIAGRSRVDAEASARRRLDKLPSRCTVAVAEDASGVVLPAVGSQCGYAVGTPGSAVKPEQARDCFIALLEAKVDAVSPAGTVKPNVVIILTDDQRWDTIDATHESPDRQGPVMPTVTSELVNQGVLFTNAFVTRALCCPSRASILRGQYASTTGIHGNAPPDGGAVDFTNNGLDAATLATWLDAAGYRTGLYGKYLNGYANLWDPPAAPYVPPGWDEWHAFEAPEYYDYNLAEFGSGNPTPVLNSYPSGCPTYVGCPADDVGEDPCPSPQNYSTDVLLAKALDFIDQAAGQPFFLYFAPYAPHGPACPAARHQTLFQNVPAWRPPNYDEAGDESDKPDWVQDLCPMSQNKKNNIDALREYQLGSLQAVDEAVGAIMQKLRDLGQDDNTLVLFTSDNGFSWGSHCHRPKSCPYEECMRVPLVVRYPPLAPTARVEPRFGLNIDFALTFAELAGTVPTVPPDGRSAVRVLADTETLWRTDFLFEHWDNDGDPESGIPTLACVRNQQFKYVEYSTDETELYDLTIDPYELQNQAGNPVYAATEAALAARLRELRPSWSPSGAFLDEALE